MPPFSGNILLTDDDPDLRRVLRRTLDALGFKVLECSNGEQALRETEVRRFDAILLDVNMPGIGGIQTCRQIRSRSPELQILMLTVRDREADIVEALDAGADDYITKPFAFRVLLARLRAITRRAERPQVARLQVEDVVLDPATREVTRGGKSIALTATEYRLLEFLMRCAGRAVSRSAIIEGVWGFEDDIEANTVDAFIRLLREKLDAGYERKVIQTVRGYGYILREDG